MNILDIYPSANFNSNYLVIFEEEIDKLEVTPYVPGGQSKDHHYSHISGTFAPKYPFPEIDLKPISGKRLSR